MRNDKWKETPVSLIRLILVISYYYLIFSSYIPEFVYNLQIKSGIYTNGTIMIQYQVLAYLLGLIPIAILMFPLCKEEKKVDIKKLIITFIFLIVIALFMNALFFVFITFMNNGEFIASNNQTGLNELMKQNIFLHHFMIIVLAPCLEELVFRGVFFRTFRNKYGFWVCAIISSILFGLIHVSSSILLLDWLDVTYLILYAGLGFLFCCTYEYNKTIFACILMHMLYNAWTVFM